MPYALIIAGVILTVAGVRNTQGKLYSLLEGDLTGQSSFVWWLLSILLLGSIGYIQQLKQFSNMFMALVLVVLILSNSKSGEGVFQRFMDAMKQPVPQAPVAS